MVSIGKNNKIYSVAVIGAGGMGARWARALSNMRGIELRYICDADESRAASLAKELKKGVPVADWNFCANDPELDIAVIALPHHLLAKAALDLLKKGKHVLVEKPGAISSTELKKAVTAARKKRLKFMVGYNHRYHDAFLKMRSLFGKGVAGEPLFIRAKYGFGGRKNYSKEWRFNKKVSGGGELIDQGVHMLDLVQSFLGDIKSSKGFIANNFWGGAGEDNAFVLLKNKKGAIASIHASWTQWKPEHLFELYGTKGYLIVEGLGKKYGGKEILRVGIRDPKFVDAAKETVIECDNNADHSLVREFEDFIKGKSGKMPISPESSLGVLEIVENIYKQHA